MNEQTESSHEWTPLGGMIRGTIAGLIAAVILAAMLIPVARYGYAILLVMLVRAFIAFLVAWIIYGVVERFAGMTGWFTTILTCVLAAAVMVSNHLVWSGMSLPLGPNNDMVTGYQWMFRPDFLLFNNIGTVIGIGACAVLCRDGQPEIDVLGGILSAHRWGT